MVWCRVLTVDSPHSFGLHCGVVCGVTAGTRLSPWLPGSPLSKRVRGDAQLDSRQVCRPPNGIWLHSSRLWMPVRCGGGGASAGVV
jgi:hypothetical protein